MPQNAHIVASGGDYTTPIAWEAGEQNSDYSGAITVGRVDGFFDAGSSQTDFNGAWVNGARLECFDSADGFDGTERQLCGLTSAASITLRNRGHNIELEGLELYNTSTGQAYTNTSNNVGDFHALSCLFKADTHVASAQPGTVTGLGIVDCVLVSERGYTAAIKFVNSSVFADTTSTVGTSSTAGTADNTVTVNLQSGNCYRATITQSNNASTDTTADTLDNIVIADNFESATPVASGDYRIKAGSPLDTNGIGAFIQTSGGVSMPVIMNSYRQRRV